MQKFDVIVVGAGVFGAWCAWHLAKRKQRVLLLDAFGPAHSRASSGGESRIIRMNYSGDALYTEMSLQSLGQWKDLFERSGQQLFLKTGVLWMAGAGDSRLANSRETLREFKVPFAEYGQRELQKRYPQVNFDGVELGILETESGVLLARRAVAATVEDAIQHGAEYRPGFVKTPRGQGTLESIQLSSGERIEANQFVFACGSWLAKLFPEVLGRRIFSTRQEVFFFSSPAGDARFQAGHLPTWLFEMDDAYGMPDIESRGLKIARDSHGAVIDPDTQSRLVTLEETAWARAFVARRFPALKDAPISETRVCQYENTSNGDFLIDRHPDFENVWFAGGGSGHGFKHGPAVGAHVSELLLDGRKIEPRFALESKQTQQNRTVH